MANEEQKIYVYENWSHDEPLLMGILFVSKSRGSENYSFEYDDTWLKSTSITQFILDPNLEFYQGRQYPIHQELFGIFSDSCPDRWGQTLMKRRELIIAQKEGRKPKTLTTSDFLLGVYDETRMGALRFKTEKNGPFLSDNEDEAVPPWATLRDLEEASRGFETNREDNIEKWIKQLIKPGSSLGGARPKATIQDTKGELWIAKFPSKYDETDIGAWEKLTMELAKLCGLKVPQTSVQKFSKYGSTFLTKRFDRIGKKRIHFSSAMTLLGKIDGASAQDGSSYLDIVDFIKAYGATPNQDIHELWKRIIFNMAVSNTDDHLRNHGFLLSKKGWILSPLYDVNPIPHGDTLSLNVTDDDNRISLPTLINFSELIGMDSLKAKQDIKFILQTVHNNWESLAKTQKIPRESINQIRSAFDFSNQYNSL